MRKELFVFLLFVLLLEVNGTVQPPGNITIRARTSTVVTFSFVRSSTGGATYEATFTSERSGIPQLGPFPITNTFYSVSGLIPDVDYTLSIVAISGSERSTPVTVNVTTLPAVPNGPPLNVTQESNTSTSITLTWNDPDPQKINDRDGITGFRLFQDDQFVTQITTRRYQFTGLSPGIEYTFKILAVNEQGSAPDRHAASFTGRTAPGVPAPPNFRVILPRFSLAFLIWSEPVPYVGEITKYEINYTVDGVRLNVPQKSGTTKSFTINIDNHIGKTHAVSIRASTASGWGDFSEPVEFVFQPIVNVSIQPVDCSTVAVDYIIQPLPGEDNAAQLDQFVLRYHKRNGSSDTIELSEDISTNTSSGRVYVHNLEKDTFYDFSYSVDVTLTGISVTPPGDFPIDITYCIPNDCGAITTSLLSTTKVLPITITVLPSTTTAPPSTTTPPPSSTTAPPSTTTAPPSTTTVPSSTTTAPPSTTTLLSSTTTAPPSTTTAPPSTTTLSSSTTASLLSTELLPTETTAPWPTSTTLLRPSTKTAPPSTTTSLLSTTEVRPTTTTAPPSTTTAQLTTTAATPTTTTTLPTTTAAKPTTTAATPTTTTSTPTTTAAKPTTTAAKPTTTTSTPTTTAAKPDTTAPKPATTTATPTTTAATPTTTPATLPTTTATPTTTPATPTTPSGTVDIHPSSSPTSGGSLCRVSTSVFAILFAVIIYLI